MKITIKGNEKKDICIRIPTRLALNGLTAKLATSKLVMKKLDEKDMPPLTYEQMKTVIRAIHEARRRFPDWTIVEVEEADGEKITVKL